MSGNQATQNPGGPRSVDERQARAAYRTPAQMPALAELTRPSIGALGLFKAFGFEIGDLRLEVLFTQYTRLTDKAIRDYEAARQLLSIVDPDVIFEAGHFLESCVWRTYRALRAAEQIRGIQHASRVALVERNDLPRNYVRQRIAALRNLAEHIETEFEPEWTGPSIQALPLDTGIEFGTAFVSYRELADTLERLAALFEPLREKIVPTKAGGGVPQPGGERRVEESC